MKEERNIRLSVEHTLHMFDNNMAGNYWDPRGNQWRALHKDERVLQDCAVSKVTMHGILSHVRYNECIQNIRLESDRLGNREGKYDKHTSKSLFEC
jgi:hypothetical protein